MDPVKFLVSFYKNEIYSQIRFRCVLKRQVETEYFLKTLGLMVPLSSKMNF